MYKSLLVLLFYFILGSLSSQPATKVYTLNISNSSDEWPFRIEEVIDQRPIKGENIGYVSMGMNNNLVPAALPDSLDTYLEKVFNNYIGEGERKPLVMIVHDYTVGEYRTAFKEIATFEYQVEFAKRKDGELYSVFETSAISEHKGIDVTNGIKDLLLYGIREVLVKLKASNWQTTDGEEIDLDKGYELDLNQELTHGMYRNYNQFLKQEPFQTQHFSVKASNNGVNQYMPVNSNNKTIRKGGTKLIVYNDILYLNASLYSAGYTFSKPDLIGKYIYLEDRQSDAIATAAFGMAGALASSSKRSIVIESNTGKIHILANRDQAKYFLKNFPEVYDKFINTKMKSEDVKKAIEEIDEM